MKSNLINKRFINSEGVQTRAYSYKTTNRKSLEEHEKELKEERDAHIKAKRTRKNKRNKALLIETR